MSIRGCVQELEAIRKELKSLNARRRILKQKEKNLEEEIKNFLRSKNQHGVKFKGKAILLEEKEVRKPKKAKERDADAIDVLRSHGIHDAERVLKKILDARRGVAVPTEKIVMKEYKK